MKLELEKIKIDDIQFAEKTYVDNGVLKVNKEELISQLEEDKRIKNVNLDLARPGDQTRIIPVKDVIQPRLKVEGEGKGFPGMIDKMAGTGKGVTKILDGAAVVTIGEIVGIQEGLIDMWGKGAEYTPFSKTQNLVVDITPVEGLEEHDHEEAVRLAGLKAAEYLGKAAEDQKADEKEVFEMDSVGENIKNNPDLPRVAYIEMMISQGLLHDTYIYGVDSKQILPTLIHPNEILDGAMVSGNCVAACDKITTYQHQNNSVILDLYKEHGKSINFMGVILTPELVTLEGKTRSCMYATNLAKNLGAEGVVISEEGYGNPDADLVENCKLLEEEGIKTTLITDECAGQDGMSQSLADANSAAKAVVSTGNVSHPVELDPANKVIGNQEVIANLAGGSEESLSEDGSIVCELNAVIGSTSEIGYHCVTAKLY